MSRTDLNPSHYIDFETGEIIGSPPPAQEQEKAAAPPKPMRPEILAQFQDIDPPPAADAALVRLNPAADEKVIALSQEIVSISVYAQRALITNPEEARSATNDLTAIASLKKAIEEKRKEYKAPIIDYGKEIDRAFEMITAPLEAADDTLRKKLLAYNQELARIRQEAIDLNRLKEDVARREAVAAKAAGEPPPPPPQLTQIPAEQKRVRADIGTASLTWVVDKDKVDQAVAKGVTTIPGIHIWNDPKWKVLNLKLVPEAFKKPTTRVVGRPAYHRPPPDIRDIDTGDAWPNLPLDGSMS